MAPEVARHFTRFIVDGVEKVKCLYCEKSWRSWNDTQKRIHLSDRTTTKENGSKVPLCTAVTALVAKPYIDHFADLRKTKADASLLKDNIRRSELQDVGHVDDELAPVRKAVLHIISTVCTSNVILFYSQEQMLSFRL